MQNKKIIWISVLVSVTITFLGCVILGRIFFQNTLQSPPVAAPIVSMNTEDFQNTVLSSISGVLSSIVSISANADIKSYVDDPSQVAGPTTVSGQVKLGWASGILVSKDWYVLTNKHAVENMQAHYQVHLADGRSYSADKVWLDPALDLAVLKIVDEKWNAPDDLSIVSFLPFDQLATVGQFVLAIGNTLWEYPNAITFGILSAQQKLLTINQKNIYTKLYQTDAQVAPGNSWGPLIDIQWHVIGIVSALDANQHITFALPLSSALIQTLLSSIAQYGGIVKPLLGIEYLDITSSIQQQKKLSVPAGVLVTSVLSTMPAAQAGIKNWDILISIDDKPINLHFPLLYHLYTYLPDATATFTVLRGGQTLKIPVKLWQNSN